MEMLRPVESRRRCAPGFTETDRHCGRHKPNREATYNGTAAWWLRAPRVSKYYVGVVSVGGNLTYAQFLNTGGGVRPALPKQTDIAAGRNRDLR